MPNENNEKYVPEKLVDFKVDENGEKYYLVKWSGCPKEENSWVHRSKLGCYFMMDQIEREKAREEETVEPITVSVRRYDRSRRQGFVPFEERITGFDLGRTPEMVLGLTDVSGELEFLIKWKGVYEADLIPREIANVRCPQIVIKFYEENLFWKSPCPDCEKK
ncbi:chromobox protein homolog 1-like isoform X2 [Coccinella septempunctata]|uniref:chromobox protein homolog 1-like isoform X2 n=1 Tax=Coccinella septempunctata TaxID=41139 RepID=UPI001D078DB3|nr:chromobox protein homolog 1-like isoform X2 [Coccinella septempunctata]